MRLARPTLVLLAALPIPAVLSPAAPAATPTPTKPVKRAPAKAKPKPFPKIIVTADLLPGSSASVEIPSIALPGGQRLIGTPATRSIPLSGFISGPLADRFRIGQDIKVDFDTAQIKLGSPDILTDPACGNEPTLRLNPASIVTLDRSKPSRAVLKYSKQSQATANVLIRVAFDMRPEPGCGSPLVTTGFAETPFTENVSGTVGPRGLVALEVASQPETLTIGACLFPGAPDKPCAGGLVGYPVKISVRVTVRISLKRVAGFYTPVAARAR